MVDKEVDKEMVASALQISSPPRRWRCGELALDLARRITDRLRTVADLKMENGSEPLGAAERRYADDPRPGHGAGRGGGRRSTRRVGWMLAYCNRSPILALPAIKRRRAEARISG